MATCHFPSQLSPSSMFTVTSVCLDAVFCSSLCVLGLYYQNCDMSVFHMTTPCPPQPDIHILTVRAIAEPLLTQSLSQGS